MDALLRLENVSKRFGGVIAAENVGLDLCKGEICGLIGPNGAGKTTLLNLISGIYKVDGGTIIFDGHDITKDPSHARAKMGLGRTFQTPRFLNRATIEENLLLANDLGKRISFLKSFFGFKDNSFIDELDKATRMAGFCFCLENDMSSLTFGQKKLLEIIRSILTKPKVILVDEPVAGLNRAETDNAIKLLEWAAYEKGIGIILIEHAMDMIMNTCGKITVLNFGKVIACGTPKEIAANEEVKTAYLGRERNVNH